MIEQSTHVLCREISAQRPGGVDVAEGLGHVGNAGIHHALVCEGLGEVNFLAIDFEFNTRHDNQFQAGGCDDDVSVDLSAVGHR